MSEQQRNLLCIFCLKPSPHSKATAFPYLRVLSRFLNIPPDFEQKCESICKYLGSCGDCSKPCESFSKLFFEWERKGLLLTSIAGELFDIIHRSKLVPSESRALEKSFEETLNINENVDKEYAPIKEVRQVLLEHCEREVMDSFPKVTISMEDEKKCIESELKKKKKMRVKQAATVPKTRKKLIGVKRHDLKHQATSSFQAPKIKCPLCRYRTRYRGTLSNHLTHVHKRVLAYQCHSCPVKLQTVDGFRKHMLNLHSKEFKTQKMLMSAENVSYSCFDVKWVAESEEESGLGLLVLPSSSSSSSSSLSSTLSHVSEMKDGKNSTALESETATSNSDEKTTKELQLQSTSRSEEEKLPAEKDKQLGYGCKSCHKRYTNQRALGHHIVYQHENPVDALNDRKEENNVETIKCPHKEFKVGFASVIELFDHFDMHISKPKDEVTRKDLGESPPETETGTASKNQQIPDSERQILNGGCSTVSLNDNDYSGPTGFDGTSNGDSNLEAVNGNQDNYSFK